MKQEPEDWIARDVVSVHLHHLIELIEAYDKLQRLEDAGVDNWEGYDDAMEGIT